MCVCVCVSVPRRLRPVVKSSAFYRSIGRGVWLAILRRSAALAAAAAVMKSARPLLPALLLLWLTAWPSAQRHLAASAASLAAAAAGESPSCDQVRAFLGRHAAADAAATPSDAAAAAKSQSPCFSFASTSSTVEPYRVFTEFYRVLSRAISTELGLLGPG